MHTSHSDNSSGAEGHVDVVVLEQLPVNWLLTTILQLPKHPPEYLKIAVCRRTNAVRGALDVIESDA